MSTQREWTTIREYDDILFDYYNGIARITINRERYRNAFTPTTTAEMSDALRICREEADIDVIVITGAGDKAFCSGGDQNVKGRGGYIFSEHGGLKYEKARCLSSRLFENIPLSEGAPGHFEVPEAMRPKAGVSGVRFEGKSHSNEQKDNGNRDLATERAFLRTPLRGAPICSTGAFSGGDLAS